MSRKENQDSRMYDPDSLNDAKQDEALGQAAGQEQGRQASADNSATDPDTSKRPKSHDGKHPDAEGLNDKFQGNENPTRGVKDSDDGDDYDYQGKGKGLGKGRPDDNLTSANRGVGRIGGDNQFSADPTDQKGTGKGKGKNKLGKELKEAGNAAKKGAKDFGETAAGLAGHGLANATKAIVSGVTGFVPGVRSAISKGVGKVARTLGVSNTTAGILATAVTVVATVGGVAGVSSYVQEQNMIAHEMILEDDCAEDIKAAQMTSTPTGDDNAMQEANAAKAWAVFKAIGLTDEQAAGAIGNMVGEGGLSPYTMECDFITAPGEKWGIGPIKQGFVKDLNSWTLNYVFPYYTNIKLNKDFYNTSKHGYVAGVGLCGFTGMHYDALEAWATGLNTTWYDPEKAFDVQMSFILAPPENGGYNRSTWLRAWKDNTSGCGSPESAAEVFCLKFEGNSLIAPAKLQAARKFYDKFKGTMGDESYANSILELAAVNRANAAGSGAGKESEECETKAGEYDNSDLARAAVAYAYETTKQGINNNGTELYQAVFRAVSPNDQYYQSCDSTVGTAVRWSGADDNFPMHNTGAQLVYCSTHPDKWESVGSLGDDVSREDLKAGDVLVFDGHVILYVSNEIVKEKYPNSTAEMVSGSIAGPSRSPGCQVWDDGSMLHDSRGHYQVFRLKKYDENSIYKDVVKGQNLKDR